MFRMIDISGFSALLLSKTPSEIFSLVKSQLVSMTDVPVTNLETWSLTDCEIGLLRLDDYPDHQFTVAIESPGDSLCLRKVMVSPNAWRAWTLMKPFMN